MNTILVSLLKPTIKGLLVTFLQKQFASKTFTDFKTRVSGLSPDELLAAFQDWVLAQVEKF
jgi:hypothetical protein